MGSRLLILDNKFMDEEPKDLGPEAPGADDEKASEPEAAETADEEITPDVPSEEEAEKTE